MLVEIALVHLGGRVGGWCNEGLGRVSVAAGFVFLSGVVAGAVYSRTAERGAAALTRRCARRCLYIYRYHVAAFVALLALVLLRPHFNSSFHFPLTPAWTALHTLASFAAWLYQPSLFDILPMYGLFVLCMPAALLALRSERGVWVWLASLIIWGLAQLGHGDPTDDTNRFGFFSGAFNPFAWQFVFFSGLYFGHKHLYRGRGMTPNHRGLIALCTVLCVLGLTMRWQLLPWPAAFQQDGWLATRRDYGAAYLINFLALAYLVYCLATHVPRLFQWRPLAFLGQHSIQVFSFHIVAVYFLRAELARIAPSGGLARDAVGIALVAALFIPAWCHAQWQRRRDRQRGVAAACVVPSTSTM
jgi:hypothetical protein